MRAVVQRVSSARVRAGDRTCGEIGRGLVVLVGVSRDDTAADASYVAAKIRDLRLFEGEAAKPMDRSVIDISGAVLSLSGGSFRPAIGTVFTLIENDDAGDGVRGQFAGLGEGGTVRFGGIEATISSPTFVLMGEYAGRLPLFHIDLYRLASAAEALDGGLIDDRQGTGVVLIEWPDRLGDALPADRLDVQIDGGPDERRRVRIAAVGTGYERYVRALAASGDAPEASGKAPGASGDAPVASTAPGGAA